MSKEEEIPVSLTKYRIINLEVGLEFEEDNGVSQINFTEKILKRTQHLFSSLPPPRKKISKCIADTLRIYSLNPFRKIGEFETNLDATSSLVRTTETEIANFTVDACYSAMEGDGAELAIMNAGSIRWDRNIPKGPITEIQMGNGWKHDHSLVMLSVPGETIMKSLENGVSRISDCAGRFPMVSGLRFLFDPKRNVGSRVIRSSVLVQGQPIELKREYKLCTGSYLLGGGDGYTDFAHCSVLLPETRGRTVGAALEIHFRDISGGNGGMITTTVSHDTQ